MTKKDAEYFRGKFISIAMPAYNEQDNIPIVVNDALKVLRSLTDKYEVLIVNDGSKDKTGKVLDELAKKDKHIRVIHFSRNKGVGFANYTIYKKVRGEILFWNASDNQIRMKEIYTMLPHIKNHDIVVGNRYKRKDSLMRRVVSRAFSTVILIRFGVPVRDVDSVKVFKTSVFKKININARNAFIESEILIKARRQKLKILEVPINHYPRIRGKASGLNMRIVVPQLTEFLKYFFGLR